MHRYLRDHFAKAPLSLLLLLCLTLGVARAAIAAPDGFDAVRCGSDIPQSLIGKVLSKDRVSLQEGRHKAIQLQVLGATEVSNRLFLVALRICGAEFMLLEDKSDTVRDVLPFPLHSRATPQFVGTCTLQGKPMPGLVVATLLNKDGKDDLAAKQAWTIDEAKNQFVKTAVDGLFCPRDGIATVDGGP